MYNHFVYHSLSPFTFYLHRFTDSSVPLACFTYKIVQSFLQLLILDYFLATANNNGGYLYSMLIIYIYIYIYMFIIYLEVLYVLYTE